MVLLIYLHELCLFSPSSIIFILLFQTYMPTLPYLTNTTFQKTVSQQKKKKQTNNYTTFELTDYSYEDKSEESMLEEEK